LDRLASGLPLGVPVQVDATIYGCTERDLWRRVQALPDDVNEVLVIGHNPSLHELASELANDGDDAAIARLRHKFPTAALATFAWRQDSWSSLKRTQAVLHSFTRPRDL